MKLINFIFLFLFFISSLVADERIIKLDRLFNDLKINSISSDDRFMFCGSMGLNNDLKKMYETHLKLYLNSLLNSNISVTYYIIDLVLDICHKIQNKYNEYSEKINDSILIPY